MGTTNQDVVRLLKQGLNHYGLGDLEAAIAAWEEASDTRPVIKIRPGRLGSNLAATVKALAQMEPPVVYQRTQMLVRIAHLLETAETQGCLIPKGTAHIVKRF